MERILRRDMEKLFGDTRKVKQGLEMLEKDHAAWARGKELNDLVSILEGVKSLEFDVSVLMSDCVSLDHKDRKEEISIDFNQAFKNLNILFGDLKTLRNEINRSYAKAERFDQLEIDWGRFKKALEQIQRDLGYNSGEDMHSQFNMDGNQNMQPWCNLIS